MTNLKSSSNDSDLLNNSNRISFFLFNLFQILLLYSLGQLVSNFLLYEDRTTSYRVCCNLASVKPRKEPAIVNVHFVRHALK